MENIRDLMSGLLFTVLFSCILMLALNFFSLDQTVVINFALLYNLQCLTIFLVTSYIYSRFSENITANSFKIADNTYNNSLWYAMAVKQQKALILLIARSQKEFRLTGLGMVNCSLATFSTVKIHFLSLVEF